MIEKMETTDWKDVFKNCFTFVKFPQSFPKSWTINYNLDSDWKETKNNQK